jgi:hypothetical protein
MARCPSCSKFQSLSMDAEPEIDSQIDTRVDEEGEHMADITGTVKIVLTSECCGDEMKEATFDIDLQDIELTKATDCTCEGETWHEDAHIADESGQITDRQESSVPFTYKRGPLKGQTIRKPIPPRFQKHYYGAQVDFSIHCPCGKEIGTATFEDDVQASGMDELT